MKRIYRINETVNLINNMRYIRIKKEPIYAISVESVTPYSSDPDNIIQISIFKCFLENTVFNIEDKCSFYIKPEFGFKNPLPKYYHIEPEFFNNKPTINKVKNEIMNFVGTSPIIFGYFGIKNEIHSGIFLEQIASNLNIQYSPKYINLFDIAYSVLLPRYTHKLNYQIILKKFNIGTSEDFEHNTEIDVENYIKILNKAIKSIPSGLDEKTTINNVNYWSKEKLHKLYLSTNRGGVEYDLDYGYFTETEKGYFDVVKIDVLFKHLLEYTKTNNIKELKNLYVKKGK